MIIILMGVAGSGKTTIGSELANQLGWPFYEGDDFHPADNVARMRSGVPLTDADRKPWLAALGNLIASLIAGKVSAVVACSALKSAYRDQLRKTAGARARQVRFVYLRISSSMAEQRLQKRKGHFMRAAMVRSQFEALEEPDDAIVIDATLSPSDLLTQIRQALEL